MTYAVKEKSVVKGSIACALGLGSIAIDFEYNNQDGIEEYTFAKGYYSKARAVGNKAIAIDTNVAARAYTNVILEDDSAIDTLSSVYGYSPFYKSPSSTRQLSIEKCYARSDCW